MRPSSLVVVGCREWQLTLYWPSRGTRGQGRRVRVAAQPFVAAQLAHRPARKSVPRAISPADKLAVVRRERGRRRVAHEEVLLARVRVLLLVSFLIV